MPTLHWVGKDKVVNHHHDVPFRLLNHEYRFTAKDGTPNNSTDNRIIHGDNLEALKSLLPEFEGKVKCIYIDPPYNTGKEGWVYNDNVNDPKIKKWLGQVVGKEGEDLSRHDKWLCMMYPRLKLLHKLLADDGMIFISINDVESASLRLMCDDIFGANNFLTQFIWNSEGNTDNQLEIKINHEYIITYLKKINNKATAIGNVIDPNTREDSNLWQGIADNNINKNGVANPPSVVTLPVGFPCAESELFYSKKIVDDEFFNQTQLERFISDTVKKKYGIEPLSGLPVKLDDLIVKNGKLTQPCRLYGGFANQNKLQAFIDNGLKPIDDDGAQLKFYLNRNCGVRYTKENSKPSNILSVLKGFGTTERMKTTLKDMGLDFSYPKPVELIKYLLEVGAEPQDSIVLDSFAGSGTTAEAVLRMNESDNGNRKFICIEMMDYAETTTSKRVKAVMDGYVTIKHGKTIAGLGGGFDYFTVGEPLFLEDKNLNEAVGATAIRSYVAYTESIPLEQQTDMNHPVSPYTLGVDEQGGRVLWVFYYEREQVTTLDMDFLATLNVKSLSERPEAYVIYADKCTLSREFMTKHGISFKRIPRDITRF